MIRLCCVPVALFGFSPGLCQQDTSNYFSRYELLLENHEQNNRTWTNREKDGVGVRMISSTSAICKNINKKIS